MKCCWMLLVCVMGIAACTTEELETSAETQAVYQGKRVPVPAVYFFKGSLPTATASQVWVIAKSPLYDKEDLAVLVDTADGGKLVLALRVAQSNMGEFNLVLGKTGAGYLRPLPGTAPPPPPDVWPTYFMAAGFRAIELNKLAVADAYLAPAY